MLTLIPPVLLLLVVALGVAADWWSALPPDAEKHFVGRQRCAECHQKQHELWTGSDHDLAMQVATPKTVLGDFNDVTFEHYGVKSRLFRKGDEFFVTTEGREGEPETFRVRYTYGVRPLQQYLVAFPEADKEHPVGKRTMSGAGPLKRHVEPRLQALPIAWDTEKKKWFLLDPEGERITPDDVLYWTGRAMNWNHMCADCHSTDVHKGFDLGSKSYHTHFVETDVSCEACHGPGSLHTDLATAHSLFWDRVHGYGLVKLKRQSQVPDPKDKTYRTQIETCARCHAHRSTIYPGYEAGHDFLDHYEPILLDARMLDTWVYHVDGQIKPEVETYVYGSFLQSKMFRKGVRCTDCHDPHTTKLHEEGNKLCVRCHQPERYDSPVHHHHKADSKGARCVECHMPATIYMHVDPRRDHSIRIPRPDLTEKLGVPNACNNCHDKKDETPAWAAEQIVKWVGQKKAQPPHFAEVFAQARVGDREAEADLIRLARPPRGEDLVGPIVRATAVSHLQAYYSDSAQTAILQALEDPEAMVRVAAVRSLESRVADAMVNIREALKHPDPRVRSQGEQAIAEYDDLVEKTAPLLSDRVRAVRIVAAQFLTHFPETALPHETQRPFRDALAEFKEGLQDAADQAGSHFALGLLAERQNGEAIPHYLTTLQLDTQFQVARLRLAHLFRQEGNLAQAEELLREGLENLPENADDAIKAQAHYDLALLLRETGQLEEAAKYMGKAAELAPEVARFHFNYGWTLQEIGRLEDAENAMLKALKLSPRDDNFLYGLVLIYRQQKRWELVQKYSDELRQRHPREASYRELYGEALFELGETQKAAEILQNLAQTGRVSQIGMYTLARLYEQEKDIQNALRYTGQLLRSNPTNEDYQELFQRLRKAAAEQ